MEKTTGIYKQRRPLLASFLLVLLHCLVLLVRGGCVRFALKGQGRSSNNFVLKRSSARRRSCSQSQDRASLHVTCNPRPARPPPLARASGSSACEGCNQPARPQGHWRVAWTTPPHQGRRSVRIRNPPQIEHPDPTNPHTHPCTATSITDAHASHAAKRAQPVRTEQPGTSPCLLSVCESVWSEGGRGVPAPT